MRRLLIVSLFCAVPSLAAADLPPPAGYIESCRADWYPAEGCVSCNTWHSDESPCALRPEMQGLTRCCRSAGASVWNEVWCPGTCPEVEVPEAARREAEAEREAAGESSSQQDDEGGGCAASPSRGGGSWVFLLLAGVLLRRRRGRSSSFVILVEGGGGRGN